MKYLLTLCILCLTTIFLYSQKPDLEKLEFIEQLRKSKEDSNRANILNKYGEWWQQKNLDSAGKYYLQALKLSDKIDFLRGKIHYRRSYTYFLFPKSRFDEILKLNFESLEIAKSAHDNNSTPRIYANIGTTYTYLNKFDKSIEYFNLAINEAEKNKNTQIMPKLYSIIASSYNNMASTYSTDVSFLEKAYIYNLKAIEGARTNKDSILLGNTLVATSTNLNNLEKYDKALPFALEGVKISIALKQRGYEAEGYRQLGKIYIQQKNYPKAIEYLTKSVNMYAEMGASFMELESIIQLGLGFSANKDYKNAKIEFEKAISKAKINKMEDRLGVLYTAYGETLNNLGDSKAGLDYFRKGTVIKDSLEGIDLKKTMLELEGKYENSKKEVKINQLQASKQKQNTLIYSLIASLFVVCLIGFIAYRNINYRRKLAENEIITLQKEKQLTATESIIQGQEEERSRLARDLHDGLGGLLSGIKLTLNNMTGNVILSEQSANTFSRALGQLDNAITEMRRVAHSMMPEALLKFGLKDALNDFCEGISQSGKIKVHFQSYNFDKRLDQTVEVTIYRIIQELLNNTLKHAEATEVFVQLNQDDQHLTISVEDNGKGFDINKLNEAKGIGIKNVENRVAYLNGKLDIQSSEGKGTLTLIEIENT